MVDYATVLNSIETPRYNDREIKEYQNTKDIIKELIYCFKKFNHQAKPIAKKFSTGNITNDARQIHDFIKKNIKYDAEPEGDQTSASFVRILHDKHGDCKHSALLASSIGWNLGYNVIFRFVGYHRGESYGHVYVLLENPKTKQRVVVDPLQIFGKEKPFIKHIDYLAEQNKNFNPMALSRLTGIPQQSLYMNDFDPSKTRVGVGNLEIVMTPELSEHKMGEIDTLYGIGKKTKAQRKEKRAEKKVVRKEKIKKVTSKLKSGTKKIALAPVRGAFDALLLLNFNDIAYRLSLAIKKDETSVQKFATKFGYNYATFKKLVLKGAVKKPLFAKRKVSGIGNIYHRDSVGVIVAASTTASMIAAAPIIVAVLGFLKTLNISKKKEAPNDEDVQKEAVNDVKSLPADTSGTIPSIATPPLTLDQKAELNKNLVISTGTKIISTAQQVLQDPTSLPEEKTDANNAIQVAQKKIEDANKLDPTEETKPGFYDTIKNLPTPVKVGGAALIVFGIYKLTTRKK